MGIFNKTPEEITKRNAKREENHRKNAAQREKMRARVDRINSDQKEAKRLKYAIICPNCGSEDVAHISQSSKNFSVKKAVIGGAIAGSAGLLAGALGSKGKSVFMCNSCHRQFVK